MIPNYNFYLLPFFPVVPDNFKKPPRLYDLLESIVNYDKDDKTKIRNLSKEGRKQIFDFEYPLTENISKESFETMILNHFITRRIGFETFTVFRIMLENKLNEIMPLYNKMFDALKNWEIFNSGEITIREGTDNRKSESQNKTKNELNNSSTTETEDISDRRNSELPQNQLQELRDGNYVTDYNYDTNKNKGKDNSNSTGNSESQNNSTDENIYKETITRTPADKIAILKEMQENIKSIYNLIYKDLECLFYQLV